MDNIKNLSPIPAIIFEKGEETLILKVGQEVLVVTDDTDYEKFISGEITFVNKNCIELNNGNELIRWEYIEAVEFL